jgi:AAA ATPase domain
MLARRNREPICILNSRTLSVRLSSARLQVASGAVTPSLNVVDLVRSSSNRGGLMFPCRESFGEGAVAARALLHRQDGAAAVGVDDRDVKPRTVLEQLHVALHVGVDGGKLYEEESIGHLDGESGKRGSKRLLGLFHQDAGDVGDAAAGEISRQVEHDLNDVAGTGSQSLVGIAAQRPGHGHSAFRDFPSSARTASPGASPGPGDLLVGRREEIDLLLRRWEQAKQGDGSVVLISGEPGIGKSRIAQTVIERLSGEPHTRLRLFWELFSHVLEEVLLAPAIEHAVGNLDVA